MSSSFHLDRSRCSVPGDPHLREEIQRHTGSEAETARILRSIERFGSDLTIEYYEMTPKPVRRTYREASTVSWTVTAVRRGR